MESMVLQRQGQKYEELVEEPKFFIHRPEEQVGNDPSYGEGRQSGVNQVQASARSFQRQAQRTSEEVERSQEHSGKRKRQIQLAQSLPTRVQDSKIRPFSHGQCVQYGQKAYGICSQGEGKDEEEFSM
ncbi:hypothetical protein O181_002693 [Austropuccinia psidii MF-1]|uniref:Uncharacterized protein n=1 Tax=Austropuccinia psidii MF-1 TaxID=1389203 RepID=A0A9Q3BCZ7_9BASI|nr:hypothetical protein [Austropuccinia psidii MF-1]